MLSEDFFPRAKRRWKHAQSWPGVQPSAGGPSSSPHTASPACTARWLRRPAAAAAPLRPPEPVPAWRGGGCAIQVETPFHSVGTGSQADAAAVSAQPQGSRPPHREAGTRGCKTELRQKNKQRERRKPPQFNTPLAGSQTASSLTAGPFAGASGGRRAGSCPQS